MDFIIKLVKLFNSICNYVYKIVGSEYIYIFFNVMLLNKFIATNFKLLSQNLQIEFFMTRQQFYYHLSVQCIQSS